MEEKVVKWANEEAPLFNGAQLCDKYKGYDVYSLYYELPDGDLAALGYNFALVNNDEIRWASTSEIEEIAEY